jgi:hypothetical protein
VIAPAHSSYRNELVSRGAAVARRYSCEVILPKWRDFLASQQVRVQRSSCVPL